MQATRSLVVATATGVIAAAGCGGGGAAQPSSTATKRTTLSKHQYATTLQAILSTAASRAVPRMQAVTQPIPSSERPLTWRKLISAAAVGAHAYKRASEQIAALNAPNFKVAVTSSELTHQTSNVSRAYLELRKMTRLYSLHDFKLGQHDFSIAMKDSAAQFRRLARNLRAEGVPLPCPDCAAGLQG
jgi:hypothetical protein